MDDDEPEEIHHKDDLNLERLLFKKLDLVDDEEEEDEDDDENRSNTSKDSNLGGMTGEDNDGEEDKS